MLSIDLFAGCGGLSKGLHDAGFKSIWANEFDKNAASTFRNNFKNSKISEDDIRNIDANSIRSGLGLATKELDIMIGGFPCQGFSTYGQRSTNDERNLLYLDFIRFVEEFRPKRFLIENVVGILSMHDGAIVRDICNQLELLGYQCEVKVLQAAEYGVPQLRRRVFISGFVSNFGFKWPTATNFDPTQENKSSNQNQKYITVGQAISDLPIVALKPTDAHVVLDYPTTGRISKYQKSMRKTSKKLLDHSAKQLMSFRKLRIILIKQGAYGSKVSELDLNQSVSKSIRDEIIEDCGLRRPLHLCRKQDQEKEFALRNLFKKPNLTYSDLVNFIGCGGFANKYRRLDANKPSHTLVAHMARDCSDFIHPTLNRFISVREAARLQSFEDSFKFEGSQSSQLKQIGNAVPPLLGRAIGEAMKAYN